MPAMLRPLRRFCRLNSACSRTTPIVGLGGMQNWNEGGAIGVPITVSPSDVGYRLRCVNDRNFACKLYHLLDVSIGKQAAICFRQQRRALRDCGTSREGNGY